LKEARQKKKNKERERESYLESLLGLLGGLGELFALLLENFQLLFLWNEESLSPLQNKARRSELAGYLFNQT